MSGTHDSSTGGVMQPTVNTVLYDDALDAVLQNLVALITNLPGNLVRPRWQPTPPAQPTNTTNWCAIGVTSLTSIDYPQEIENPGTTETGTDSTATQIRQETLEVLASFYGPNKHGLASLLRDGIYIVQNQQPLEANQIALYEVGEITTLSELVNTLYIPRCDLPITLRRVVQRDWPIRYFLSPGPTTIELDLLLDPNA